MRLARKLVLFAVMALMTLAMTASTASAQIEVLDEETDEHCSEVTLGEAHSVIGGCHIEYQSTGEIPFFTNIPGTGIVQLWSCEFHFEARLDESGAGYVSRAVLTSPPQPSFPCPRTPCDEPTHEELPWPMHLEEVAGEETLELTLCLRPIEGPYEPEGQGNTPCTVHFEVEDLGGHNYEIGHPGEAEAHCEPGGWPFDVWFENAHFLNEEDPATSTEDIEILH